MPKVKLFDEQEVMKKAMELFWSKGYHDTSIQDLVDALGISRSSLYDTFHGKRALFNKVFTFYKDSNYEGLNRFLAQQTLVRATLRQIFYQVLQEDSLDKGCKGCFIVNTTTELLPDDPELMQLIRDHKLKMEDLFYKFLKKGEKLGEIPAGKDLKAIARLLYTLLTGLRVLGKTQPDLIETMNTVEITLALLD